MNRNGNIFRARSEEKNQEPRTGVTSGRSNVLLCTGSQVGYLGERAVDVGSQSHRGNGAADGTVVRAFARSSFLRLPHAAVDSRSDVFRDLDTSDTYL